MKRTKTEISETQIEIIYEDAGFSINEDVLLSGFIAWEPPYDLYLIDETIFIVIELPGVKMEDIVLHLGQNTLFISGIKEPLLREAIGSHNPVFHSLEIAYGRFARKINFPMPIEPKKAVYDMKNGVLTMKLPILKEFVIPIEEA
ncbi:MAG: Hsp20/alpha crystallin family protein [bacterium]